MVAANGHIYQVLTKRSDRLRKLLKTDLGFAARLPHIWWGVSVENRRNGLPRVGHLRDAHPAVAFLSVEPLLESLGELNLDGIDWVIVGGESGGGARPMKVEWVTGIQRQCEAAIVPFFFKQWGGVRKKTTGRELNGRTYDGLPQVAQNPVPDSNSRRNMMAEFQSVWPRTAKRPRRKPA